MNQRRFRAAIRHVSFAGGASSVVAARVDSDGLAMLSGSMNEKTRRRGRPNADEASEKRNAILACATELFLSNGYRGVTVRKVAAYAKVSTTTVYNMFNDKPSLFSACLDHMRPGLLYKDDQGTNTYDRLCNIGCAIVRDLCRPDRVGFYRLLIKDGRDFREMSVAAEDDYASLIIAPLSAFLETRGLQDVGDTSIAHLFTIMVCAQWTYSVNYDRPLPSEAETKQHVSNVTRIFLSGLDRNKLRQIEP